LIFSVCAEIHSQTTTPASTPVKIKAYAMPTLNDYDTWDVGGFLGSTYGSTDIAGSNMGFGSNKMLFGLDVTKFFSHTVGLQARFLTGGISGTDDDRPSFQYKTSINYDLSLNGIFQVGNISFLSRKHPFALYGTIGFGVINYSPKVYADGVEGEVTGIYSQYKEPFVVEDYTSSSDLVIPFGAGVKYRASDKISITAEYDLRMTHTDKLDGFFKLLSADDHYSTFQVGVVYHLGKKGRSIEWENPMKNLYDEYYSMKEKMDLIGTDTDNDGVVDLFDREPDTKSGARVYGDGRAVDTDGDGIPDVADSNPYSNMKEKVDASGQGISSTTTKGKEADSKTPVGVGVQVDPKGKVLKSAEAVKKDEEAMKRDTDQDGVPDYLDAEPYSTRGARVDASGKELAADVEAKKKDSDKDGIPDFIDAEQFTPQGAKVDANGKQIVVAPVMTEEEMKRKDSDGDGVPDFADAEPATTKGAKVDANGREVIVKEKPPVKQEPVPTPTPTPVVVTSVSPGSLTNFDLPVIYFGRGEDKVSDKYYEELVSFALLMHNNPNVNFRVIGNCDIKGSPTFNRELGQRRADAVKDFLVTKFKIDPKRLFTETAGKDKPVEGIGKINRRVDIRIKE